MGLCASQPSSQQQLWDLFEGFLPGDLLVDESKRQTVKQRLLHEWTQDTADKVKMLLDSSDDVDINSTNLTGT